MIEDIEKTKYFQRIPVGLVPDVMPLDLLQADGDCKRLHNLNIGEKSSQKWYYLLRECQGSFIKVLENPTSLKLLAHTFLHLLTKNQQIEAEKVLGHPLIQKDEENPSLCDL
jgi:hypothetical protein